MKRRRFLEIAAGAAAASLDAAPVFAAGEAPRYSRLLVLVELKGGNDGLNTLVPFADPEYGRLRPRIGIARDQVLMLDETTGLHPSLGACMPLWKAGEMAVIQGVGYPMPNLSHFRSIEIWDTASRAEEYLQEGWLTRTFVRHPTPARFAADGVVVGGNDLGPLAGGGSRAIALSNTAEFLRRARLAQPQGAAANPALAHLLKVESDISHAAIGLRSNREFRTEFPGGAFGNSVRAAAQVIASDAGVAVVRLSLGSFDTHANQPGTHGNLLQQLGEGIAALKGALVELDRWSDALILSYSEFGRRPRENQSNGTDHGTAGVQLAFGGTVRGGLHGKAPALDRLSGDGNLVHTVDFRSVYSTVLERWWNVDAGRTLGGQFRPVEFLRA